MKLMHLLAICSFLLGSLSLSASASNTDDEKTTYLVAQYMDPMQTRDRVDRMEKKDSARKNEAAPNVSQSNSGSMVSTGGTQLCQGEFAFCASSTCVKTGREIEVKERGGKGSRKYPEVSCKCPIIDKKIAVEQNGVPLVGIAAVNEGNMQGSCTPPTAGTVWSYFSKQISLYPQESATPKFATRPAVAQTCPAESGTGSNCWNYLCKIDSQSTNGVRTATCLCPSGEGLYGAKAHQNADFVTYAGTYSPNPSSACSQYPVGFPKQLMQ